VVQPTTCCIIFIAFLVVTAQMRTNANAQTYETGDNSTVNGCSSHCSYRDPDLGCWNRTLNFFESILLSQIRNYVTVQVNIDQWRRRNVIDYKPDFEAASQRSIRVMKSQLKPDDLINSTTIERIVNATVSLAAKHSTKTITWIPHITCPIPCEYRATVWRNLFIASSVLNVCLFLAVLPLIRRITTNDANEALLNH